MSEEPSRHRSYGVFAGAALVAVGLGAAAALLKPTPAPLPDTGLERTLSGPLGEVDPRGLQERVLEDLITEARGAERPGHLPALSSVVLLVQSDPEAFAWVVDRLAEPGVPDLLLAAFIRELPGGDARMDAIARRLLEPLLDSEPEQARLALQVLRDRGLTRLATHGPCRCAYGIYPAQPAPGQAVRLVAFSPDASPISWEPKGSSAEPGWVLHLRPGAEGSPSILVRPLEAPPPGAWTVRPDDGEPGAISVGSPSAGKAAGHAESD